MDLWSYYIWQLILGACVVDFSVRQSSDRFYQRPIDESMKYISDSDERLINFKYRFYRLLQSKKISPTDTWWPRVSSAIHFQLPMRSTWCVGRETLNARSSEFITAEVTCATSRAANPLSPKEQISPARPKNNKCRETERQCSKARSPNCLPLVSEGSGI